MEALPDVSPVAALMADPTRAAILASLLDGRARASGELALCAGVSPQAASNHLSRLLAGGLLALEAQGRQRAYRLRGEDVARALEALAVLEPRARVRSVKAVPETLRFARSCYDHLAGVLGVAVTEGLVARGLLLEEGQAYRPTRKGAAWLLEMGIRCRELKEGRRPLARPCLDWSERRPHLAGALGAALLGRWLDVGFLARLHGSRAVRLTLKGRRGLESGLGLRLPPCG
jgi:DNA-binding transcriptional ArsR family regulator